MSYARGITDDKVPINRCPPGGTSTIRDLAALLNQAPISLDPQHGPAPPAQRAFIEENNCIGCTLCIQACPVDAIVGAAKQMHTVIANDCTGCELCVPPCPVDCIQLVPDQRNAMIGQSISENKFAQRANLWRNRFNKKVQRLLKVQDKSIKSDTRLHMQKEIMASVQRIRNKRQRRSTLT